MIARASEIGAIASREVKKWYRSPILELLYLYPRQ